MLEKNIEQSAEIHNDTTQNTRVNGKKRAKRSNTRAIGINKGEEKA